MNNVTNNSESVKFLSDGTLLRPGVTIPKDMTPFLGNPTVDAWINTGILVVEDRPQDEPLRRSSREDLLGAANELGLVVDDNITTKRLRDLVMKADDERKTQDAEIVNSTTA